VIKQLYRIDPELAKRFTVQAEKHPVSIIRFVAPNDVPLVIHFLQAKDPASAAYVSKRIDFDNFLFEEIINLPNVTVFQDHKVLDVKTETESATVVTDQGTFTAKIVLSAYSAKSIVK